MEKKIPSYFAKAKDYRVEGRCLHLLTDILALILCGVIADGNSYTEIVDWGKDSIEFLRKELGFELKNGIPSEDTLERVMKRLNVKEIEECYKEILKDISLMGKHIAIDGKELRSAIPEGKKHSLVQMVNVWSSEYGLSFGQMKIEEKSNEIKAIPELLKMFACRGSVVSIDAIGCQKEIIEQIEVLGGKYVIGLKSNQKELYSQVESEMTRQFKQLEKTMYIERDKTGSRGEERRVMVLENLTFIDAKEAWKGLKSVVMVERIRINKGKEERSKSYYISSIEGENANYYANIIRKHWSIENQLHRQATLWHLDMTFKEDDSPLKGQNALIHLHIIRKWALYLLKKEGSSISINRKRKKAARNHSFLKKILFE